MTQFEIDTLKNIIEISRGNAPVKTQLIDVDETEIATSVNHALQMFNINDPEFEIFANLIGLENYCSIETLRVASELQNQYTKEQSGACGISCVNQSPI